MSVKYQEFTKLNLPLIEQEILAKWQQDQAFEKSVQIREGATPFVFYEGPPSANGMPGIHHVISRTLKDLVCRYKTMQGFQVKRKGGWDTHGLPVELGVEKELGITKEDIGTGKKDKNGNEVTVAYYNQKCRDAVLRYKKEWDDITTKMGYWVDLDNPYITFDNKYIETLWWILQQLYKKGLLYESVSIQPYSPAAGTGLSSHELNQPGTYREVKDTSCVAMFKLNYAQTYLKNPVVPAAIKKIEELLGKSFLNDNEVFFLAWTTTPWTLPSNLGLTVGPTIEYVLVKTFNPYTGRICSVILAKALLHKYFPEHLDEWKEGENESLYEAIHQWINKGINENVIETNEVLKAAFDQLIKKKQLPYKVVATCKGTELEEIRYDQLLSYDANKNGGGDPFRVIVGDFVTTEDGTGIVHTAPAFGADDYKIGTKYGLGALIMVDREGKFVDGLGEFSGRYVKNYKDDPNYIDVNVDICVKLKKENRAFKVEKYEHSYPHCWRTDKPILYYPLDAWFIKTTALKDKMVELNKTIQWKPKSTGEGRFGSWLENMVDWNLSRSRFWGTPLPIWRNDIYNLEVCIGSIEELKAKGFLFDKERFKRDVSSGMLKERFDIFFENHKIENFKKRNFQTIQHFSQFLDLEGLNTIISAGIDAKVIKEYLLPISENIQLDLHKPFVDEIFIVENDILLTRVPDLIDVWFDSGAMPYAQWGLDAEKVKKGDPRPFNAPFDQNYPANFIAEGVDQTRGWFYTLHAISALLYEEVAYKTVVSNGLVLDKNGNKMSKRLGNVVNPFETIEKFGADATRWYLVTNASPWDNLKFDIEGIKEVQRKFFGTLYNTYQFFALYANVDGFTFKEAPIPLAERPEIDQWILSSLHTLIKKVTAAMDEYEPTIAGRLIEDFLDEHLSNWYVRLSRRRFWKGEYEADKIAAYQTLHECLETIIRLMAPISPFFSDAVFQNLNAVTQKFTASSVHHTAFPKANEAVLNTSLEERMQLAQDISSLILSLRKKLNIKVRQPLQKVIIPILNTEMQIQLQKVEELIKSEVNIKELEYITDTEGVIKKKIKPNFKALGTKMGTKMKEVAAAISNFTQNQIKELEVNGVIHLQLSTGNIELLISEVEISTEDIPGWSVASKGSLTVALDIHITEDLKQEGDVRELVNRIQNIRKEKKLELTDRIHVKLRDNDILKNSVTRFKTYICAEILADSLEWVPKITDGIEIEVNEARINISVIKKGD